MNLERFINLRPHLYHLTDTRNAESIMRTGKIFSTERIVEMSGREGGQEFLRAIRDRHEVIRVDGVDFHIRDQNPISPIALPKCLTNGWNCGDYVEHLNQRVFMWPTVNRLERHYNRYESEHPCIFRFSTATLLEVNPNAEFSRLNSGATRANSHLGGVPPDRGPRTFLSAEQYQGTPGTVAEVTFVGGCVLPDDFRISYSPDGPWQWLQWALKLEPT